MFREDSAYTSARDAVSRIQQEIDAAVARSAQTRSPEDFQTVNRLIEKSNSINRTWLHQLDRKKWFEDRPNRERTVQNAQAVINELSHRLQNPSITSIDANIYHSKIKEQQNLMAQMIHQEKARNELERIESERNHAQTRAMGNIPGQIQGMGSMASQIQAMRNMPNQNLMITEQMLPNMPQLGNEMDINNVSPVILNEIMHQSQSRPTRYIPVRPKKSINEKIMSNFNRNMFSPEFIEEES